MTNINTQGDARDRSLSTDLTDTAYSFPTGTYSGNPLKPNQSYQALTINLKEHHPDIEYKDNTITPIPIEPGLANVINVSPVVNIRGQGKVIDYVKTDDYQKDKSYRYISGGIAVKDAATGEIHYFMGYYQKVEYKKPKAKPKPWTDDPSEYKWNLPPHRWSRPLSVYSDPKFMPGGVNKGEPNDKYRRGRIWWKWSDESLSYFDESGNPIGSPLDRKNRMYGFQFIWNPGSWSSSVQVQMDATPNTNDAFLGGVGAFPATQTISFVIMLDRTNDFACGNARFDRPSAVKLTSVDNPHFISTEEVKGLSKFYTGGFDVTDEKIRDLFERGTLADLEYLYKAINGAGPGGNIKWKNGRGMPTADIGFLMPTLLNIDIGPSSYQGYVTSLSVDHTGFTRDMIPIRTELKISLNVLATAGMTSSFAQTQ